MRVFILTSLILGCFFGAGFVSGKEISAYFSVYGNYSQIAIVISGIILFLLLYFFLNMSSRLHNFSQFVEFYFGKFGRVVELLFALCLIILVGSMIAGSGEVSVGLGMPRSVLIILTIILSIRVVLGNIKALGKLNTFIVPIMLGIILIASVSLPIFHGRFEHIVTSTISGVEYAFMNIITLGIFMLEVGGNYTKKQKLLASIISCLVITIVLLLVNNAIMYYDLQGTPMPTIIFASMHSNALGVVAKISIWLGLFSTLTSLLYMLTNYLCRYISSPIKSVLISLMFGVVVSMFGFSVIVSYIYEIIGIIGIIVVINTIIIDKKNTRMLSCIHAIN